MFIGIQLGIEVIFQWTVTKFAVTLDSFNHNWVVLFNILPSPMFKKIIKASIANTFFINSMVLEAFWYNSGVYNLLLSLIL